MYKYRHILTGDVIESCLNFTRLKPFIERVNGIRQSADDGYLVIRKALGDVLLLFPVLKRFAESVNGKVDIATDEWMIPLTKRQSFIENSLVSDITIGKIIINLERQVDFVAPEIRKHRTLLFADILHMYADFSYDDFVIDDYFSFSENELKLARKLLNGWKGNVPLIVLAPITKSHLRNWGQELTLTKICPDYTFVVFHSSHLSSFDNLPNVINLSGKTTILEMAAVCSHCDIGVVPDSGIMHVLGVLGIPTIAIFGKVIPSRNRIAYYPSVGGLESKCYLGSYCYDGQMFSCNNTSHYKSCMKRIIAYDVKERIRDLLGRSKHQ